MRKLLVDFEITTPMFIGDAGYKASRIRESSFKGVLAFWWRALNAHSYKPAELLAREKDLFGSQDGQGAFLLRIKPQDIEHFNIAGHNFGPGTKYLAYGLVNRQGQAEGGRTAIGPGVKFQAQFIIRPKKEGCVPELIAAIKLMGLLGGLGARTRRGWGSLSIRSIRSENIDDLQDWEAPATREAYKDVLKDILATSRDKSGAGWKLTGFAQETDIRIGIEKKPSGMQLLEAIGSGFSRYRSWMNLGDHRQPGEQNFIADHDWFKAGDRRRNAGIQPMRYGLARVDIDQLPKRAVMGLPHSYFSQGMQMTVTPQNYERRGSPLFIHIHDCGPREKFVVLTHFKNLFLPDGNRLIYYGRNKTESTNKNYDPDHNVITLFMNNTQYQDDAHHTMAIPPYFPNHPLF